MTAFPSGWMQVSLSELVDSNRGISYGVVQPGQHMNNGVPILRVNNLKKGQILAQDIMRISPDIEAKYSRTRLQGGEVLITIVGTVGDPAIATSREIGWNVARAVAVIPPRQGISAKWIQICLSSKNVREKIFSRVNTTVQTTLNLKDIAELDFPLPPDGERLAIEKIICALDDKIELNRRMNATLEAMARALFKSWFVDFDPVRTKSEGCQPFGMDADTAALFPSRLVPSALGDIPEGWTVGTTKDLIALQNGYAFKSSDWIGEGIPVVKIGSVKPGFVDLQDVSYVSEEVAQNANRWRMSVGDILIGMTGYVGVVGRVPPTNNPPLLNQRVGKIVPIKDYYYSLVYVLCRSNEYENHCVALAQGSAQPNLSAPQILSYKLCLPDDVVIAAYNERCKPILDKMLTSMGEISRLSSVRDYLLPKLISGDIRIPDAEKFVRKSA